jgi:serine/threonine protein phosphatase PrpC
VLVFHYNYYGAIVRDLVSKLFGQGQEEEAPAKAPAKTSGKEVKKKGASPVNAETAKKSKELEDESSILDSATPDQQVKSESDDYLASGGLMSDATPKLEGSMDNKEPASESEQTGTDQIASQQPAIDETAVSIKPIQLDEAKKPAAILQAVHHCHIGNVRTRNEDSTFVFTAEAGGEEPLIPFGLYVLADGMGGHHAGHKASRDVSRIIAQHVLERIYLPLVKKSTHTSTRSQEPIRDVMLDAIQIANQQIHNPEPEMESGTTLTAILVFGRRIYITHIGDSRAYLMSDGQLKQLTTDHSYVRRLIDAGQLTEEEALVHPQRNMLYKAVGQGGTLDIDTFTQTLPKNGTLIICSDGLWGLVSDPSITNVVQKEDPLWDRANELINLALEAGGHDNISAILVSFGF